MNNEEAVVRKPLHCHIDYMDIDSVIENHVPCYVVEAFCAYFRRKAPGISVAHAKHKTIPNMMNIVTAQMVIA